MRRLGISIYPEHSTVEKDKEYLTLAHQYGFTRVFTCLLSVDGEKEKIVEEFKETIAHANELGFQVLVDISPAVFEQLGISYNDLSFFHELGAYGIRLDVGFSGLEESIMTYNPYGLKIEINMSNGTKYVDNIMSHRPNRENLIGCHNFYPHRYSGLSYEHFIKCSKQFKDYGMRTAAFISSFDATYGPWPVTEGLCTLEMHRELAVGEINKEKQTFDVEIYDTTTELERKIVLEEPHFYRGDVSEYMIRSTQSRVKYKTEDFKPHNTRAIKRGDLLIDNEQYGQYKGELQIALKDMVNTGKTNVVGRVVEEEIFLLDYLQAWDKFGFVCKK